MSFWARSSNCFCSHNKTDPVVVRQGARDCQKIRRYYFVVSRTLCHTRCTKGKVKNLAAAADSIWYLLTRKIFSYWVMSRKNKRFSKASLPFWNALSLATRTLEILLYPNSSDLECLLRDSLISGDEALEGAKPIIWSPSSSFLCAGKAAKLRRLSFLDSLLFLRPTTQLVL